MPKTKAAGANILNGQGRIATTTTLTQYDEALVAASLAAASGHYLPSSVTGLLGIRTGTILSMAHVDSSLSI